MTSLPTLDVIGGDGTTFKIVDMKNALNVDRNALEGNEREAFDLLKYMDDLKTGVRKPKTKEDLVLIVLKRQALDTHAKKFTVQHMKDYLKSKDDAMRNSLKKRSELIDHICERYYV